ncbi:MAG: hypothetical protein GX020_00635 [Firmicutes bacterium]|nr:hypothetical protein [Bacillota bacterium]
MSTFAILELISPVFQEHTFYALSIKEFVAHRLLNVMMCDRIIVIEEGTVV